MIVVPLIPIELQLLEDCKRLGLTALAGSQDLNFSKRGLKGDRILSEKGTKRGPSATEKGTKMGLNGDLKNVYLIG